MAVGMSLAAVHDAVVGAAPDRAMVVWTSTRRTYGEAADRTRGLAAFLGAHGLGSHRERAELERWECGQDTVAVLLHNRPEYLETMLGCYRARAVPFNVNQHYRAGEIHGVLDMLDTAAVVYQRALGPLLAEALAERDEDARRAPLLIDVDDGSGVPPLAGSTGFEDAVATRVDAAALPTPSPDDLYVVCTGGTTGTPKAVLWRQADVFVSGMGGDPEATVESIAATAAAGGGGAWFAAPPLMHGAAQWTAFGGLHLGATIVLHDDTRPFDAATILATAARERVGLMSIVGDAYARPIVEELRRGDYDLAALHTLATGGAATNEQHKEALLELLPHVTIVDGYGASETGGMAFGARTRTTKPTGFTPAAGGKVLSADRTRFLTPGDASDAGDAGADGDGAAGEVGWTARTGRVPLGYLGDKAKTEATFPIVDGERVSVPGDRARLAADGSIVMLGRDSMVVNTGGEKVFVEEVEAVLRRHDDIADALVVGRPSERFGQEVVALVQLRPGAAALTPTDLRELVAASLARFKAPRAVAICEQVHRHPNGKPDYTWARIAAAAAPAASATVPTSDAG
jgi:fatty-acyl-CoA synthase